MIYFSRNFFLYIRKFISTFLCSYYYSIILLTYYLVLAGSILAYNCLFIGRTN